MRSDRGKMAEKSAPRRKKNLLMAEDQFRIVEETVSDAIITIDESSKILFVNRAAEKVFGHPASEMVGRDLTMLMPEYMRHLHRAGIDRYLETGRRHISWEAVELPGLHSSGREVTLEVSFGEYARDGKRVFTGIARDITERKILERRLAAQHDVTRILAESPTLTEAAPRLLQIICESLGWQVGALWRLDRDEALLRLVNFWSAPAVSVSEFEAASRGRTFQKGVGLPGRVWQSGGPVWVNDVVVNSNFPRAAMAELGGIHAALAFPVFMGREVVGVLEFFHKEMLEPDRGLLSMMGSIGAQIGQVIERRRVEEERAALQQKIIAMQDALLAELSTPLIPISDRVVIMPLIGTIDQRRAHRMMDALLSGVEAKRSRVAMIDITGVPAVNAKVANMLVQAAQAVRLLGVEVMLTGIRAEVAQSLVSSGIDLGDLITHGSLKSAITDAMSRGR